MRFCAGMLFLIVSTAMVPWSATAETADGSCAGKAQDYQERWEKLGQVSDMVCMQLALQRELTGDRDYDCPGNGAKLRNGLFGVGASLGHGVHARGFEAGVAVGR